MNNIKWISPNYYNDNFKNLQKNNIENFIPYLDFKDDGSGNQIWGIQMQSWEPTLKYTQGAMVIDADILYIAKNSSIGENPARSTTKWLRLPSDKYRIIDGYFWVYAVETAVSPNADWYKVTLEPKMSDVPDKYLSYISMQNRDVNCIWAASKGTMPELGNNCPGRPDPDQITQCTGTNVTCNTGCPALYSRIGNTNDCLVPAGESCLAMNAKTKPCTDPTHICWTQPTGIYEFGVCYKKEPATCNLDFTSGRTCMTLPTTRPTTRPASSSGGEDGGGSTHQWISGIDNNTVVIGGLLLFILIMMMSKLKSK